MRKKNKILIFLASLVVLLSVVTIASAFEETTPTESTDVPEWIEGVPLVGGALAGLGLLLCCVLIFLPLIIAILVGIWMYKDAEKRGKSGIMWLLLLVVATLFLNLIGFIIVLIIWLVVRPKEEVK